MSNLFRRPRREVNKITDANLGEVSAVQGPAQPKAVWLVKSLDGTTTQLGFMPLHIAKGSIADGSWPDEEPLDPDNDGDDDSNPALDTDMDFTRRVARKRRKAMKKLVKRMVRKASRDFSDGQSGNGFFSESDRVGAQDARSPTERANDALAIIAEMERNPPIAAENWRTYADRVFGPAVNDFTDDEIAAARKAFAEIRDNVRLQKSLGDGLNELAYQKRLTSGNKLSFQKAFTEVCKERPDLYLASRGIVRKDYTRADSTMNVAGDDADSLNPEEANAYILRCADDLQRQYPAWSRTMCLVTAGSQHPGIYHRSKG